MQTFREYVEGTNNVLVAFDAFLEENDPQLCEDWRGWLGAGMRGLAQGAYTTGRNLTQGVGQAVGGVAQAASGTANAVAAAAGNKNVGGVMQNLKQAGGGVVNAAKGVAGAVAAPVQGMQAGAQSFNNRDMNAAKSFIGTVNDPNLKGALQKAFDWWTKKFQQPQAQPQQP